MSQSTVMQLHPQLAKALERRSKTCHQVGHKRSPLLRLWWLIPRRGSRPPLWGASTLPVASGTMDECATNPIGPLYSCTPVGSLRTWLGLATTLLKLRTQLATILHDECHWFPIDGLT